MPPGGIDSDIGNIKLHINDKGLFFNRNSRISAFSVVFHKCFTDKSGGKFTVLLLPIHFYLVLLDSGIKCFTDYTLRTYIYALLY